MNSKLKDMNFRLFFPKRSYCVSHTSLKAYREIQENWANQGIDHWGSIQYEEERQRFFEEEEGWEF